MVNIKLLSLFSGIGAFEKALKNLNIEYELVGYSEIDKYASKAYSLIHNESESKNLGDITKIDVSKLPKDIDLITYGFPCQDISIAGKQQGFLNSEGEKTRSGLFFNALNIIQSTQPKIAIAENVKNLTGKRFKNEFEIVLNSLRMVGYNNYYKVLNAKDYGIPQNRERVFIVSIRKDVDNGLFEFPQPIESTKRLKDILENEVDEKYYLKNLTMTFINNSFKQEKNGNGFRFEPHVKNNANCAKAITTRAGSRMDDNFIIDIKTDQDKFKFDSTNKLLQKGNYTLEYPYKVRKLTPKECFRLMGFDDKDIDILIENNISNTQLYKMAGNSIVVNVLEHIFSMLYQTKGEILNANYSGNTAVYK